MSPDLVKSLPPAERRLKFITIKIIKKIKSKVNIRKAAYAGYYIDIEDQHTGQFIAVTEEELEKIVLYGQAILKKK